MPHPEPTNPRVALEAIGRLSDDEIDLADAALQLARVSTPPESWEPARQHLSALARDAYRLSARTDDLPGQAAELARLLTGEHRYRGDDVTYDDRANANLIRVIERRRGLPVTLGILWLHAARAAGWRAFGMNVPGHFMVGLSTGADRLAVDPFAGGGVVDDDGLRRIIRRIAGPRAEMRPENVAPMTDRAILLRLQNNVLTRQLQAGEIAGAIVTAEDMARIAPSEAAVFAAQVAELRARLN